MSGENDDPPTLKGAVSAEYLAGVIEAAGNISYSFEERRTAESGYRIKPELRIRTSSTTRLAGLLDDIFNKNNFRFLFGRNNIVRVTDKDMILRIWNRISGHIVDTAPEYSFVAEELIPRIRDEQDKEQQELLRIMATINKLNPHWETKKSKKYTLDYFIDGEDRSKQGIRPIEYTRPSYPDRISPQFFAGYCDASRTWSVHISTGADYNIGYSLSPEFRIVHIRPSDLFHAHLRAFFEDHDITYSHQNHDDQGRYYISAVNEVDTIIELIAEHLWTSFPMVEFLYEDLIPAYREGYHHTKEGLITLLEAYEEVHRDVYGEFQESRQYDSRYFKQKWKGKLE